MTQNADSVWRDPDFYAWECVRGSGSYHSTDKTEVLAAAQDEANRSGHHVEVIGYLKTTNFKRKVATVVPAQTDVMSEPSADAVRFEVRTIHKAGGDQPTLWCLSCDRKVRVIYRNEWGYLDQWKTQHAARCPAQNDGSGSRLSDAEFYSHLHVDDCMCVVGQDDPKCVAYRAQIDGSGAPT